MSLSPIGLVGPALLAGQVAGSAAISLGHGFGQLLQAAAGTTTDSESTASTTANTTSLLPATRSLSQNFLRGDVKNFASQLRERLASLFGPGEDFQLRIDANGDTEFNGTNMSQSVWEQAFGNDGSLQNLVADLSDRLSQLGTGTSLTLTPGRTQIHGNQV